MTRSSTDAAADAQRLRRAFQIGRLADPGNTPVLDRHGAIFDGAIWPGHIHGGDMSIDPKCIPHGVDRAFPEALNQVSRSLGMRQNANWCTLQEDDEQVQHA